MSDDIPVLTEISDAQASTPAPKRPANLPERAIVNSDGSITLPLLSPVTLQWRSTDSGQVNTDPPIESVTFRRLTGKDVRTIMAAGSGASFVDEVTFASVRAQYPLKARWLALLDQMDGADASDCIRIASGFLENGPSIPGASTSPR